MALYVLLSIEMALDVLLFFFFFFFFFFFVFFVFFLSSMRGRIRYVQYNTTWKR